MSSHGPTRRANEQSGQITIPHWIRERHGFEYEFRDEGDRVVLKPIEE